MSTWKRFYQPPNSAVWQGRADEENSRYFQKVVPLDLTNTPWPSLKHSLALLGFCSDEGISRNQGRVGASQGPSAFRSQLAKYATHNAIPNLFDVGDITVEKDLEASQQALAEVVHQLLAHQAMPLVMGGGHETAFGHLQGFIHQPWCQDLAIINFDAHFDLRPSKHSTSGSPFRQFKNLCDDKKIPFHYYCFGIQPQSNTPGLFATAKEYDVHYRTVEEIYNQPSLLLEDIKGIIGQHQALYLTVCLDVFDSAFAPGVSAPSAQGLQPWHVIPLLNEIAQSGKLKAMDIVELSPPLDSHHRTAQLSATLASYVIENLETQGQQHV